MIFWEQLKIQNTTHTATISLNASGIVEFNQPISVPTLTVTQSAALPSETTFAGPVVLPTGSSFEGPVTLPADSTFGGTVALPSGSVFEGPVTLPSNSEVHASTGEFVSLTAQSVNVEDEITLKLSKGTTLNGQSILTKPHLLSAWLDAYQGPGENWITIRNYGTKILHINRLVFSGQVWKETPDTSIGELQINPIERGQEWHAGDWWAWGAHDEPADIEVWYHYGEEAGYYSETIKKEDWTKPGGINFGASEGDYPGSIISEDDRMLCVAYAPKVSTDIQFWKDYAQSQGYNPNGSFLDFGGNHGNIGATSTLNTPAFFAFMKAQ